MVKALLFKEFIKTRRVFFVALIFALALGLYSILMMSRLIELKGADHLMIIMILKDNSFVGACRFVPLAIGIAVAIAQMAPEMSQKRLKLTLHLPYPQKRLIGLMLLAGAGQLLFIFGAQLAMIAIYDSTILPPQLVNSVVATMMPWYFAGFAAYLFVSAICLEGSWRERIVIGLTAVGSLFFFFLQPAMSAYTGAILVIIIFLALLPMLSFRSIIRFKEGVQD